MNAVLTQRWQRLATRIEAMAQRERMLSFAAAAALLLFGAQMAVLGPLARKQDALRALSAQQASRSAAINDDITHLVAASAQDPNESMRVSLSALRADTLRLSDQLRTMEKGLVPPERIAPLLESMLRANGRLQLVSLRTLPVDTVDGASPDGAAVGNAGSTPAADPNRPPTPAAQLDAAAAAVGAAARAGAGSAAAAGTVLYRHGVELTVRGSYLDMVDAMGALEALPTQLFWGRAQLDVEDYPNARLTLTLYTLSLDPKWMKL
jgi:MSHA biogenesis protein MshJ